MPSSPPFVDRATGTLDTDQILVEAIPLAKLIGVFVAIALVPLTLMAFLGTNSVFGLLVVLAAQFVLALGTGIVLMYVITRGIQLSDSGDSDE